MTVANSSLPKATLLPCPVQLNVVISWLVNTVDRMRHVMSFRLWLPLDAISATTHNPRKFSPADGGQHWSSSGVV